MAPKVSERQPEKERKSDVLSNEQRGRLMVLTAASIRMVDAWWKGERVKPVVRRALERAAKKIRLPLPERLTTRSIEKTT